ncbi:MAG TPA: tail fiber domain-containing protein [Vicinamibacterales bacterium]|nr:tail fiber domain-containing protein [Vicinamibacterales bacterium]
MNGPLDARNGVVGATTSVSALYGGTGQTSVTTGDLLYGSATNAWSKLGVGTGGYVLGVSNGVPAWVATTTLSTISGTLSGTQLDGVFGSNGLLARTTTGTYASRTLTGTSNQITVANGDGVSGNPTLSLPSLLSVTQASSTQQSILDVLYVGRTATTTIRGDGVASTLPYASTTMITATTASTTALVISNTGGSGTRCLQAGADGTVSANASACGSGSSIGEAWALGGNGFTGFLAPTTTQKLWLGQASSTLLSVMNAAYFGGTATTTFTQSGNVLFPTSGYLNFGATEGTSGYGFRDNAGTLEFKNSGGTWQGVTTATSGPSFSVHKNGTDQTVTSGVITQITWNNEDFDTNNNFDLSTERFTPTVAGKYIVTLTLTCTNATTGCVALIYKNGSNYQRTTFRSDDGSATSVVVIDMNGSSDYVEGFGRNDGSTTFAGDTTLTKFTGALIAPVNATAGGWQNDGTQSFLADSTDKVGIGTSTPYSKLTVWGASSGNIFEAVTSASSTAVLLNSSGLLGVGTTSNALSAQFAVGGTAFIGNGTNATSTFNNNLDVLGQLKVGTGSIYLNGSATSTFSAGIQSNRLSLSNALAAEYGGTGTTTLSNLIALTTHTTGNYVATITGDSQVSVSGSGSENAGVTLSIASVSIGDTQLAFDTGQALTTASSPTFVNLTLGASGSTNYAICSGTTGTGVGYRSGQTTCGVSSLRFKHDIQSLDPADSLAEVMNIRPVSFVYNSDMGYGDRPRVGFIAEEMNEIDQRFVDYEADNVTPVNVQYSNITALLAAAVQAQQAQFNALVGTTSTTTPEAKSFASSFFQTFLTRIVSAQ